MMTGRRTSSEEADRRRLRLIGAPDVLDHHDELVATQPGDHVASASGGLQPVRQRLEELVAGRVSQPVVHALEPVQIEEQDGDHAPPSPGPREGAAKVLRQEVAVGQAGQRVVEGAEPEAFFFLTLGA